MALYLVCGWISDVEFIAEKFDQMADGKVSRTPEETTMLLLRSRFRQIIFPQIGS
jgi:hypothetical protein